MSTTLWSYQEHFDFRLEVVPGSPFHCALQQHRGDYSRQKLLTAFHVDANGQLRPGATARTSEALLFGGHVGCGKSTELRDYAELLKHSYTVHRLELTQQLDINNLRFSDLLIALAKALVSGFADTPGLAPESLFITPVVEWFDTRIVKQERFRDVQIELNTEAKASGGIPYLASLLATLSAKLRGGVSYREELRREVRDGFLQLLGHFNSLIAHTNHLLSRMGQGPLLFIIDGSDKLSREDSDTFFNADLNQLGQIQTNLIVCAPISVLLEASAPGQRFTRVQLPMVKLFDADGGLREREQQALVELVLKRMPLQYFDDRATVAYLVQHSGGHVRDLLRLVRAAFARIEGDRIDRRVAELAVRDVAAEYQRLVRQSDWPDLLRIDRSNGDEKDRTEDRLRLLYDLVLLEYNNYWWRSHPLVRTLPAYQKTARATAAD